MRHKSYENLESLLDPNYCRKDLSLNFGIRLLVSSDWKSETYISILVIVDKLMKMVYFQSIKITINMLVLANVILDVLVRQYGFPDSIVCDKSLVFTSKFWSSPYYFPGIKKTLSTFFYPRVIAKQRDKTSL